MSLQKHHVPLQMSSALVETADMKAVQSWECIFVGRTAGFARPDLFWSRGQKGYTISI